MSFSKLKQCLLCCMGVTIFFLCYVYLDTLNTYTFRKLQVFNSTSISSSNQNNLDQITEPGSNVSYHKLLKIYFSYKHLPKSCIESDKYMIVVHTSPDHFGNRAVIRSTWGQRKFGIKVFFLIANTTDEVQQSKIDSESSKFQDLIQGDFADSYRNLSYKHVLGLKFVVDECSNVKYLIKVDDDTFVNTPNLKKFLDLYDSKYGNSSNLLCNIMEYSPVLRSGRWKVSKEMFPGEYYPKYCSGYFIIYPIEAVFAIYREAQREGLKFLWVDDAFVSGVLAGKAGINHTSIEKLSVNYADVDKFKQDFKEFGGRPFLVGKMNLNKEDLQKLWTFLKDHVPKANILERIE